MSNLAFLALMTKILHNQGYFLTYSFFGSEYVVLTLCESGYSIPRDITGIYFLHHL